MEYVIVCSATSKCKPILQQFIGENRIDESKVHKGLIPYRIDVSEEDHVWVVPVDVYNQWFRFYEHSVIFEV